jgi:hypothetical protein
MLLILKKVGALIELLGPLDTLSNETREALNSLIIIRSNLMIIRQNKIKKEMRKLKILRKPCDSDEELILSDSNLNEELKI